MVLPGCPFCRAFDSRLNAKADQCRAVRPWGIRMSWCHRFSLDAKAAGPGKLEFETSLLCRVSFYVEQC
jgi:hypothetical protein